MIQNNLFLGLDPGGERGFGVATLLGRTVKAITVSCVAEAVDWLVKECGSAMPAAAGIDTMLHWGDGPGGWRPADRKLRAAYPTVRSSISSPNGLYGSMGLVGHGIVRLGNPRRTPDGMV